MDETIGLFTPSAAARYSGVSARRLAYWHKVGVLEPTYQEPVGTHGTRRYYSLRDLVAARTLNALRDRGVSLQELRKAHSYLSQHIDTSGITPWAALTFYVLDKSVIFEEPSTKARIAAADAGQRILDIPLRPIVDHVRHAVEASRERTPEQIGTVSSLPGVMGGEPCIGGTRIPSRTVWSFHEAGYGTRAILREYPTLQPEGVEAAITFERGVHTTQRTRSA